MRSKNLSIPTFSDKHHIFGDCSATDYKALLHSDPHITTKNQIFINLQIINYEPDNR